MDDILFLKLNDTENISHNNEWLLTSSTGKILKLANNSDNVKDVLNSYRGNLNLFVIIPDKYVSFHIADLPIKERKKQLQAIPFILEEQIITDIDETHFVIGEHTEGNQYITAVINKITIERIIRELEDAFGKMPRYLLTEAMCLYKPDLKLHEYNLYFNKEVDLLLLYNKNIIHTDLNNASLVLSEISKNNNLTVDIYKYKITNIVDVVGDSINDITIRSEQEIDNWLVFLVNTWFKNNSNTKFRNVFNLMHGYINLREHNLKFHSLWKQTAVILSGFLCLYIGYKYLDNLLFSHYNQILNQSIKNELLDVNISSSDFKLVEKELDTKIAKIKQELEENNNKNIFYTILSVYAKYSLQEISLKKLNFNNNVLDLNFNISRDNLNLVDRIKEKLADDSIDIKEKIDNDGKIVQYNWQLTLKK